MKLHEILEKTGYFSHDDSDSIFKQKGGEKQMGQQVFDSTDYGEMTLAKLDSKGVEFLLNSVEKTEGKFGDFIVLLGVRNGEPYEIRAGGRAAKGFIDKENELVGKVISIIPRGSGMDRKYAVSVVK